MSKYIFDFLYQKIGNQIGAAALMGNLYVESKLEPTYLEGSYAKKYNLTGEEYTQIFDKITASEIDTFVHDGAGYGLAQWTYWSRKKSLWQYAQKKRKSVGDLDTQLGFLWEEIQTYKTVMEALTNAKSIREASDVVAKRYEKPEHLEEKYLQNRANYGQQFYDQFQIKMEVGGDEKMATYKEVVAKFLAKIDVIYNSNPRRREPGDGSDGYCDCIGLIIGAIRRMGLKWPGIHGSNYSARMETTNLAPIKSASDLEVGDVVYKAVPKGNSKWSLPTRYRSGGKYYNGDLNDYYHAGTVYSVNPLKIKHMSDKMRTDTKINVSNPWNYHGKLTRLINASSGTPTPDPDPVYKKAVVVAQSGGTVNLRAAATKNARIMVRVPLGSTVSVVQPGETWAKITWNKFTGYMMAEFLDIVGDGKGKY